MCEFGRNCAGRQNLKNLKRVQANKMYFCHWKNTLYFKQLRLYLKIESNVFNTGNFLAVLSFNLPPSPIFSIP